jgi:nicotinamide-nucleotide amidase
VRLRLSGYSDDKAFLRDKIDAFAAKIIDRISNVVVAEEDIPLEKAILNIMEAGGLKLAVAESCTGGYISQLFTQHPGSSKVFLGGAITYSNKLKERLLDVKKKTLHDYGAVSEETVTEMVKGALKNFKSDYAIAITGIAGPDGGSPEKPVGTVWIGVASSKRTVIKKFTFGNKRVQNIERSAISALSMLNTLLRENKN